MLWAQLPVVLPLVIAVLSVSLGVALGLARGPAKGLLGPVRTFALVAAMATVLLELAPGAAERGGWPAIVVFGAAALLPWAIERLASARAASSSGRVRLELGYLALLVHHVGDGLGLGAYSGDAHHGHVHWDVLLAIGGHTVPVTAVVVLAFQRRGPARAAAARGLGFAAAIALGLALARVVPVSTFAAIEPSLTAAVAGLLLHVATHDWLEDPPGSPGGRLLDLVGAGLGVALVTAAVGAHDHHAGQSLHGDEAVSEAAVAMALRFSPPLLAAAVLGALLARSAPPAVRDVGGFLPALRAAVLGATVGPARAAIAGTRAAPIAAALGAAGLALSTLSMSANAFSPGFAGAWMALGAVAIAIAAVLTREVDPSDVAPAPPPRPGRARWLDAIEESFAHAAAPAGLGILVAAALAAVLRDGALAPLSLRKLDVVVLPALALATRAPAVALVAPLWVLVDKGANAPAALAALAAAAAAPSAVVDRARLPARAWLGILLSTSLAGLALALVRWPGSPARVRPAGVDPVDAASAAVLAALALAGAWRRGVRPFIALGIGRGRHHSGPCLEASAGHAHEHGRAPSTAPAADPTPR